MAVLVGVGVALFTRDHETETEPVTLLMLVGLLSCALVMKVKFTSYVIPIFSNDITLSTNRYFAIGNVQEHCFT